MLTLIENCEIYSPFPMGLNKVLVCRGKIIHVGEFDNGFLKKSNIPYELVNAEGNYLFPGFIDPHEHLIGGSGEKGFSTLSPEIYSHELVAGGITTVVGCLGVDTSTRTM